MLCVVAHFKVPSDKREFLLHHNMSEAEDIIKVVSPYCIFNRRRHISGCHVDGRKGNWWWVVRGGLWSWNGWVGVLFPLNGLVGCGESGLWGLGIAGCKTG